MKLPIYMSNLNNLKMPQLAKTHLIVPVTRTPVRTLSKIPITQKCFTTIVLVHVYNLHTVLLILAYIMHAYTIYCTYTIMDNMYIYNYTRTL